MSHTSQVRAVLTCFAIAVMSAAESPCCIATPTDIDSDGGLDDSARTSLSTGYTPFPRFFPSHDALAATQPSVPSQIALCTPDLYCSLASN